MLRLTPCDVLNFSENNETILNLANLVESAVVFKIQTTSPDKFRVRPRYGVLQPGESATSNIQIKPGHSQQICSKDKFRVFALSVLSCQAQGDISSLMKQLTPNNPKVEEYRLSSTSAKDGEATNCMTDTKSMAGCNAGSFNNTNIDPCCEESDKNIPKHGQLQNRTQCLQYLTLVMLLFLSIGFVYLYIKQLQFNEEIQAQIQKALQCGRKK